MNPEPFFPEIRDAATGRIRPGFAAILRRIESALEAQKRWKEAPPARKPAAERALVAREKRLRTLLRPRFRPSASFRGLPADVAESFAAAVLLSGHFRDTVGRRDPSRIRSSLPLATFPHYAVHAPSRPRAARLARALSPRLGLGAAASARMRAEDALAGKRIRLKEAVISGLLAYAGLSRKVKLAHAPVAKLFKALFVTSPLRAGEVELVATDTSLYFCIPSIAGMKASAGWRARTARERAEAEAFLGMAWKFRFDYFSHFPSFSFFDSKSAAPALRAFLERRVKAGPADVRECLNHAVGLLDRSQVEQYLIHDTWGHVWQDDLTSMRFLYDRMAGLHFPLAPDRARVLGGNVVSIADLIYVTPAGAARLDRETARRFIHEDLQDKIEALFAPVVAELTADVLEHKFLVDRPDIGHLLTSSSAFGDKPTKFDFAWNDLSYYMAVLRNPNEAYDSHPELREAFLARLDWLLDRKTPYHKASKAGRARLEKPFREFLALYRATTAADFHPDLGVRAKGGNAAISAFFQVYANALHIGYALNVLLEEEIGRRRPAWLRYREILVLFAIKWFERDPRRNFWAMDEMLAAWALPLLGALARIDAPDRKKTATRTPRKVTP